MARDLEGRPEVAYLSPIYPHDAVALTSPGAPLARFDAWVSCVAAAPGAPGFLVFAGDEAFHLTHVGDRLQSTAVGRTGCWVRAASVTTAPDGSESGPPSRRLRRTGLEPDLLMALICGGEVQPSPRQTDAEDEPVPWLMNAEVRLARVEEGRLVLGEAEVPAELNPWRIKSGRFAGEENLLVFVYKRSPFDPIARRRPFVYRVIGGEDGRIHLQPRWRGTSFSHPFVDADFGDFTGEGRGEIAALEVGRDGGRLLTAYRFKGFGLEGLAPTVRLPEVEDWLAGADVCGDERDELLVRAGGGEPAFAAYGLTNDKEPQLVELARAVAPERTLGWVALERDGEPTGRVACLTSDGALRLLELRETP